MAKFIQSLKSFRFTDILVNGNPLEVPAHFIGEVPDDIEKTILFKWAVADGSITYVGQQSVIPGADLSKSDTPIADDKKGKA